MKKIIEHKLDELAIQKESLVAQLNGAIGAEQALKSLLEELFDSRCEQEVNNEN